MDTEIVSLLRNINHESRSVISRSKKINIFIEERSALRQLMSADINETTIYPTAGVIICLLQQNLNIEYLSLYRSTRIAFTNLDINCKQLGTNLWFLGQYSVCKSLHHLMIIRFIFIQRELMNTQRHYCMELWILVHVCASLHFLKFFQKSNDLTLFTLKSML